ncbi:MAG: hypothetical protein GXY25_02705 [Pirellulaceae bacterium]|nr:hypothetical protein [Thermoguttaceae bacterium]NLY99427.1 hypothetical protein [Pirellulaceae bacterium]
MNVSILAVLALTALPQARLDDAPAQERVANGGFEELAEGQAMPAGWSGDRDVFSRDATIRRSGGAALKCSNSDPGRYRLAVQKVPLKPGRKYRLSGWVKTENVSGRESGATLCLEWQGKDGRWMGGCYPDGIKGTRNWTKVEAVVRVPAEAAACHLACYLRQGITGTAWFDDVAIERLIDPPMRSVLISPNYRGRITSAGPGELQVRIHLDLVDHEIPRGELRLEYALKTAHGEQVSGGTGYPPATTEAEPTDLRIPAAELAPGRYDLAVRLIGPNGKQLQETHHPIERMADPFAPAARIDAQGRLIVDGKPFLPLGMYWSGINEDDLKIYAESKLNCLMPYASPSAEQMDLAWRYGLKVIYSVKDFYAGSRHAPASIRSVDDEEPQVRDRVRRFRDHPALLAWYLNDELPQTFLPRLEAHQRWVAEEDPNHPTWVVLYQYREVAAYLDTFDVIGTDPYPIGRSPASQAAAWTAETRRQVDAARPLWQVPQVHNWINYAKEDAASANYRSPSFDEMRSMAWQCLCEGATGLVFYSWYDLKRNPDVTFDEQWGQLKRIVAEIDRFAPALLAAAGPALRLEVSGGESRPAAPPEWLHWLVREHRGKVYIFAVNDGDGAGEVAFRWSGFSSPAEGDAGRPLRAARLTEQTGNRFLKIEADGFVDRFEPLAVHVYELAPAAN